MIRLIQALLWLRWRSMINWVRSGARRGTAERLARLAEAAAPILLAALLVPSALGAAVLGFWGGLQLAADPQASMPITAARVLLAAATMAALLLPLFNAMQGGAWQVERLLLLPVSRASLHAAHVASGLSDPVIWGLTPALLALSAGLLAGGAAGAALLTLAAAAVMLATLLALQAAVGSILHIVFRDRRRAEWVSLVMMALLVLIWLLPALLQDGFDFGSSDFRVPQWVHSLLATAPSELYARFLRQAVAQDYLDALSSLAGVAAIALGLFLLSWRLYLRLLETPAKTRSGAVGQSLPWRIHQLPWLSPGGSAVAASLVRTSLRSGRIRLAILFTPLVPPLLGTLFFDSDFARGWPVSPGILTAVAAIALSMLNLQPVLLNAFGSDRAGLTLQFLSPLEEREIVRGKLAGGAAMAFGAAVLGILGSLLFDRSGSIWIWLALLPTAACFYAIAGPLWMLLSIFFPKAADLNSWGREGNPHQMAGLLGTLLLAPALAAPLGVAALSLILLRDEIWLWVLLLLSLIVSLALGRLIEGAAVGLLAKRHEALASAAQGR